MKRKCNLSAGHWNREIGKNGKGPSEIFPRSPSFRFKVWASPQDLLS